MREIEKRDTGRFEGSRCRDPQIAAVATKPGQGVVLCCSGLTFESAFTDWRGPHIPGSKGGEMGGPVRMPFHMLHNSTTPPEACYFSTCPTCRHDLKQLNSYALDKKVDLN